MKLREITVGQVVRVRAGYGWSVEKRNVEGLLTLHEFRDMGGHVTRVLGFVTVFTEEGRMEWPQVYKGCLAFHLDPANLEPVPDGVLPDDES